MFYTALRLIDERLRDVGQQARSHRKRLAAVERHLPGMYRPYSKLYALSLKARYMGIGFVDARSIQDARRAYEQIKR